VGVDFLSPVGTKPRLVPSRVAPPLPFVCCLSFGPPPLPALEGELVRLSRDFGDARRPTPVFLRSEPGPGTHGLYRFPPFDFRDASFSLAGNPLPDSGAELNFEVGLPTDQASLQKKHASLTRRQCILPSVPFFFFP